MKQNNMRIDNTFFEISHSLKLILTDFSDDEISQILKISNDICDHKDSGNILEYDINQYSANHIINKFTKAFGLDNVSNLNKDQKRMLISFLKDIHDIEDIETLRKSIIDDLNNAEVDLNKIVSEYEEQQNKQREMMEKTLLEKAELEENPETKQKMIDTSMAYTNGYTLNPLIEYMNSDVFKSKYKKALKRFNRLDTDFTHKIQSIANINNIRLLDIKNVMKQSKGLRFSNDEIDRICTAIGLYARDVCRNYKPDVWFLYCVHQNIVRICTLNKVVTKFDRERLKYFVEFFEKIAS